MQQNQAKPLFSYRKIKQLATLEGVYQKQGRNISPEDLGIIEQAAVVFSSDEILWVGSDDKYPAEYNSAEQVQAAHLIMTPELVDSHTHLIFGGDRASEYRMRLNGADYQEIAKAGGGILNTMKGTRGASEADLFKLCCQRVEKLMSYGVGTIEVKTGYGLDFENEYRLAKIVDRIKRHFNPTVQIFRTTMAAHALPPEYKSTSEYINEVVLPLLDKLVEENLVDAVDIFHEQGYFETVDVRTLFDHAVKLNLPRKIHADEFVDNKGGLLATEYDCLSADHLLATGDDSLQALAKSNTVATLLPGTGFFLGKPQAPARKILDAGAQVAIASDYNPGSCHFDNLLFIASLAAPTYGMKQAELWSAITFNAAQALGLKNQGALRVGMKPRFSFFHAPSLDHITYHWGDNFADAEELKKQGQHLTGGGE